MWVCREDFSVSIWEPLDGLRLRISRMLASGGAMNVHGFSMSIESSVTCIGDSSIVEDMIESRCNAHADWTPQYVAETKQRGTLTVGLRI